MICDIKDLSLADKGLERILWADQDMPVLGSIRTRFKNEQPLQGIRIAACLHVTAETANLMRTLKAGGAEVSLCAANSHSTQDDTAAALVKHYDIPVFAIKDEDAQTFHRHIDTVIDTLPHITMDDSATIAGYIHERRTDALETIIGGTEQAIAGALRLVSMSKQNTLKYPVITINEAKTKRLIDNRYGTGQSTLDGIIRATNRLLAGKTLVVSGYGWCGKGLAERARGMGAHVIVCEVDPLKALEAIMDGFGVMPAIEAARVCDIWITATGNIKAIDGPMFEALKDGAIICNTGHSNNEINIPWLEENAVDHKTLRPSVEQYTLSDGRTLVLLAEGRLVSLNCAEGHPASVMDMNFANLALSANYLIEHVTELTPHCYGVPEDINTYLANLKLQTLGVQIDTLTSEQIQYLNTWDIGIDS